VENELKRDYLYKKRLTISFGTVAVLATPSANVDERRNEHVKKPPLMTGGGFRLMIQLLQFIRTDKQKNSHSFLSFHIAHHDKSSNAFPTFARRSLRTDLCIFDFAFPLIPGCRCGECRAYQKNAAHCREKTSLVISDPNCA
jgi:hypothetical protein